MKTGIQTYYICEKKSHILYWCIKMTRIMTDNQTQLVQLWTSFVASEFLQEIVHIQTLRLWQKARSTRSVFLPLLIDWRFFVISFVRTENDSVVFQGPEVRGQGLSSRTRILGSRTRSRTRTKTARGSSVFRMQIHNTNTFHLLISVMWTQLHTQVGCT